MKMRLYLKIFDVKSKTFVALGDPTIHLDEVSWGNLQISLISLMTLSHKLIFIMPGLAWKTSGLFVAAVSCCWYFRRYAIFAVVETVGLSRMCDSSSLCWQMEPRRPPFVALFQWITPHRRWDIPVWDFHTSVFHFSLLSIALFLSLSPSVPKECLKIAA